MSWNASSNPPETAFAIEVSSPTGGVSTVPNLQASGSQAVAMNQTGNYTLKLVASLDRIGETRQASEALVVAFP